MDGMRGVGKDGWRVGLPPLSPPLPSPSDLDGMSGPGSSASPHPHSAARTSGSGAAGGGRLGGGGGGGGGRAAVVVAPPPPASPRPPPGAPSSSSSLTTIMASSSSAGGRAGALPLSCRRPGISPESGTKRKKQWRRDRETARAASIFLRKAKPSRSGVGPDPGPSCLRKGGARGHLPTLTSYKDFPPPNDEPRTPAARRRRPGPAVVGGRRARRRRRRRRRCGRRLGDRAVPRHRPTCGGRVDGGGRRAASVGR
jgi:hypothetical protein